MSSAKSLATSLLPSPPNTKVPFEQSSKPHNKHVKKCVRDLMSDSLSQSNASSIHESSDMSSITSFDDSTSEYAKGDSPSHLGSFYYPLNELRRKYKREFKDAIRKNYKYMMSENIMDSCKLTENEFSAFDSDEVSSESNAISYNEFVRQYQELITWLTNMHENINQNQVNCCNSEKYLNQAYHEELLHRLTRRTQFQEYSRQLIVHYPNKRNDILAMCNRVDQLWMELEKDVVPAKLGNPLFVIEDIEQDLQNFENWIIKIEEEMNMSKKDIENKNASQQFITNLQKEVQSKSKFVTSISQMCENLLAGNAKTTSGSCSSVQLKLGSSIFEERVNGVKRKAGMLQHRWEAVYISCLEWQLRIEGNLRICKLAEYNADDSDDATDDTTDGNLDTFGSNNCLSMIEEEKDQDLQFDAADVNGVVADVLKEMKRHQLTHDGDVGYSSDGLQSPIDLCLHTSGLVRSSFDEGNRNGSKIKTNECNMGSDMSDSSGVGISATTGSCMSRSEAATNSDQLISGSVGSSKDSIGILVNKVFTNYDSSVPATEDEFSNDEVKNVATSNDYSTIYSRSVDMLTCYEERNLKNLIRDGSVSDGEVLKSTDSNITKFHIPDTLTRWNKHKTRLHLNEESPGDASFDSPSDKVSLRKYKRKQAVFASPVKLARKRALNNNDNLSLSDDQLARKFKSEKSYHKIRKIMSFEGLNLNLRHYDVDENEEDEQLVVDLQQRTNNIQGSDQRVPDDELMSNTADEISSLQSEFELTDVEVEDTSFKSNVDIWLKDNIFDRYYYKVNKHSSTPKSHQSRIASRQLPFCDYLTESDSEAEEFKATLEDHNRAFTYTQQVVQDIADTWAANPQQTPDPNKLMEPLATCETSLMCLQDLKAALTRSNSACFFYEQQIKIVEGMLKKWSDLKMYICQQQQHACSLIYSETLKLEEDLSRSVLLLQMLDTKECAIITEGLAGDGDHDDDDEEEDDDESGTALQILVETIKAYKAEKDHLFALKERFGQLLKRNCQPVSNNLCEKNYRDEGNVFEKIGKLNNICEISLEKATRTVMSLLSAVEPCNKFIELKRLITTSLDQSQQYLQSVDYENSGPALVQLLSSEMKGGWIDLRVKVSEMCQLNTSICQHVPMKKILKLIKSDLEKIDGRYKELQLQSSSVIEKLISNKCSSLGASVLSDNVNRQQHGPSVDESLDEERASDPSSSDRQTGVPTAVCGTPIQEGNSGVVKVMRNILKVGVPLSAAVLFLGWVYTYSSSGLCNNDWFADWGIVIFPNLRYPRERPAI